MKEAKEMYLRALVEYEKAWGAKHTSIFNIVNNLGILYSDQNKIKEAKKIYLRILIGYEKAWGAEYTSILRIINNLRLLYSA